MKGDFLFKLLVMLLILLVPGCARKVEVSPKLMTAPVEIKAGEERQGWEIEWERVTTLHIPMPPGFF